MIISIGSTVKFVKDSKGRSHPKSFMGLEGVVTEFVENENDETLNVIRVQWNHHPDKSDFEPLEFLVYCTDVEVISSKLYGNQPNIEFKVEYKRKQLDQVKVDKYKDLFKKSKKLLANAKEIDKGELGLNADAVAQVKEIFYNANKTIKKDIKNLSKEQTTVTKVYKAKRKANGIAVEVEVDAKDVDTKNLRSRLLTSLNSEVRKIRMGNKVDPSSFQTEDGFELQRQNGVYHKSGQLLDYWKYLKKDAIYAEKKPTQKDNYVGIEIEFYSPIKRERLNKILAKRGLGRWVQLTTDGSLHGRDDGDEGIEMRILVQEKDKNNVLRKVSKILKDIDAIVSEKCGLHVHIDMRNRDVKRAYNNLYYAQKFLVDTQEPSRRNNKFCRLNSDPNIENFSRQEGGGTSRYRVINADSYKKFKTLEIRSHSGCTDGESIINWLDFIIAIVNHDDTLTTKYRKLSSLSSDVSIPENAYRYIDQCLKKYKEDTTSEVA